MSTIRYCESKKPIALDLTPVPGISGEPDECGPISFSEISLENDEYGSGLLPVSLISAELFDDQGSMTVTGLEAEVFDAPSERFDAELWSPELYPACSTISVTSLPFSM